LSLIVAVIVASSEAILFIIWQSRRSGKLKQRKPRRTSVAHDKKDEKSEQTERDARTPSLNPIDKAGLRHRTVHT
jgi:hypothetical protein